MIPRSWLYVPGDSPDKLVKSLSRGADAVIVDLEDAVSPVRKELARRDVAAWLADLPPGPVQVWVRINPGALGSEDVAAIADRCRLTGIVAAKVESSRDVEALDAQLASLGQLRMPVIPLLESAAAVLAAADIARAPRVHRLQVGEVDLMADLGMPDGAEEESLRTARSLIVLASASAGCEPPVAPVARDFRNLDQFRASTRMLRAMGYLGRACIHPAQVSVANDVFTPDEAEVTRARDVVDRYERAAGGVVLDGAGAMVDRAVVRQAQRILSLLP